MEGSLLNFDSAETVNAISGRSVSRDRLGHTARSAIIFFGRVGYLPEIAVCE